MRKAIAHLCDIDPVMRGLIAAAGPCKLRANSQWPTFESLARAIAHQQLHRNAANAILARVEALAGGRFPQPRQLLALPDTELRRAGFSLGKIQSLKDLAAHALEGHVPEHEVLLELESEDIIERLTQVRGIGRWTVEMMLIFQLGRPDVLPVLDFGVRNGFRLAYGLRSLPLPAALATFGLKWGPYRSIAAWYLWRAVELAKRGALPVPAERIRLPRLKRRKRRRAKAP
ncbi:MAG TPA: hypothetical protein VMG11_13165 [Steroidobacteraceae bacterium]|nr:hypothetical protein [Steroidobacteraceae bacterium]